MNVTVLGVQDGKSAAGVSEALYRRRGFRDYPLLLFGFLVMHFTAPASESP